MKISPIFLKILKVVFATGMAVILWQYLASIDRDQLFSALQKAGAGFGWVVLSTASAYLLGTLGWWYCLGDARAGIPVGRLFLIRHVCETVGLFNPASFAGGDMLKVFLLRNYPVDQRAVLTSVVISRMLMVSSQLLLLIFALCWAFFDGKIAPGLLQSIKPGPSVLGGIILGLFLFFILKKYIIKKIKHRRTTDTWQGRVAARISAMWLSLGEFYRNNPQAVRMAFLLFSMHWIIGSLEFYIVLRLFGLPVSVPDGLLLDMGVIAVKSAGAFIPGQLGIEELGNKLMLSVIGISSIPLWISVSALRRTRQLFWIVVGGIFYWLLVQRKPVAG